MPCQPAGQAEQSEGREQRVRARPVRIHDEGVGDRPPRPVPVRVLEQRRLGKRGARPDQELRRIHGVAGVHDVAHVPVAARRGPRRRHDERDRRGSTPAPPRPPASRDHAQDDERQRGGADLHPQGDAAEQPRVRGVGADVARVLVRPAGHREHQAPEQGGGQGQVGVREARRHDADPWRGREEDDRHRPRARPTPHPREQRGGAGGDDAAIERAGEADPGQRITAGSLQRGHEPRGDDVGRQRIPRLHREGLRRARRGDRVLPQPERRVDHVVGVVVPDPQPGRLDEMGPRPHAEHAAGGDGHEQRGGRERTAAVRATVIRRGAPDEPEPPRRPVPRGAVRGQPA